MALEAQNNPFTSILMVEAADPEALPDADPAAGQRRLAVGTDHVLYLVSNTGVKTAVAGSGLSDPMTTRGDIIVRNASNTTARLAIGAARRVLSSDGTDISWALPQAIGCIVSGTSTALTSGAMTQLAFATADTYDPLGFHDPASNNTRLTVPAGLGGVYRLRFFNQWPSSASANTDRRMAYIVNGSGGGQMERDSYSVTSVALTKSSSAEMVLAAGDYVECQVWTGIGSTTTVSYGAALFLIGA